MIIFHDKNFKCRKITYLTNFIFAELFSLSPHTKFYKICDSSKSRIIFSKKKKSSQLYRSQFFEINSLMAKTIKNQFSETKFL